jgi:hypothetical protein
MRMVEDISESSGAIYGVRTVEALYGPGVEVQLNSMLLSAWKIGQNCSIDGSEGALGRINGSSWACCCPTWRAYWAFNSFRRCRSNGGEICQYRQGFIQKRQDEI